MAVWKCRTCGSIRESRCKPRKCSNCGGNSFVKEEESEKTKKSD